MGRAVYMTLRPVVSMLPSKRSAGGSASCGNVAIMAVFVVYGTSLSSCVSRPTEMFAVRRALSGSLYTPPKPAVSCWLSGGSDILPNAAPLTDCEPGP